MAEEEKTDHPLKAVLDQRSTNGEGCVGGSYIHRATGSSSVQMESRDGGVVAEHGVPTPPDTIAAIDDPGKDLPRLFFWQYYVLLTENVQVKLFNIVKSTL